MSKIVLNLNEPYWEVNSYADVLDHFRSISPTTTVIMQKVAFSEISFKFMEMTFFIKQVKLDKYC